MPYRRLARKYQLGMAKKREFECATAVDASCETDIFRRALSL